MSPIVRAGRAEERTPVVATDAIGVRSRISYVSGQAHNVNTVDRRAAI